jgi:hypothetical protein
MFGGDSLDVQQDLRDVLARPEIKPNITKMVGDEALLLVDRIGLSHYYEGVIQRAGSVIPWNMPVMLWPGNGSLTTVRAGRGCPGLPQ